MTQPANRKEFELDHLLHPAGAFRTPMDVVNDPDMTVQEKRAILASWASDACAVEAAPDLRRPPTAPVVRFDDIMDALKRLDGETADKPEYGKFISRARRFSITAAAAAVPCSHEVRHDEAYDGGPYRDVSLGAAGGRPEHPAKDGLARLEVQNLSTGPGPGGAVAEPRHPNPSCPRAIHG